MGYVTICQRFWARLYLSSCAASGRNGEHDLPFSGRGGCIKGDVMLAARRILLGQLDRPFIHRAHTFFIGTDNLQALSSLREAYQG